MNIRQSGCLRGPNSWAACPVIEAALDLRDGLNWSAEDIQRTMARLLADLPDPKPEKPQQAATSLLCLAQAFGQAVLKLQEMAGTPVSFTAVRGSPSQPGLFRVASEFAEETVGEAALETTARLLQAASEGRSMPLEEDLRRLRDLAYEQRLYASTAVIYHAARARGIPAVKLSPEYPRFLRLGQGSKQHRCQASETDDISAVAKTASTDKHLAKQLLQTAGIPIPVGRLITTIEEAWAAACELGLPVAMKPKDTDLATGVSLDLRTREQVEAGYHYAREHSRWILVERFAPGLEHRVMVVADRVVAVTRIDPPQVAGDGVSTVAELVDRFNADPRRGDEGSSAPLNRIKLDDVAREVLSGQGCTLATVLPAGEAVLLRRNPPYFRNGGRLIDLTDDIHPSIAAHAIAAAQMLRIRVAGLDVVAVDIRKPLEEQGGVIVEINAGPGLWLHMAPWADSPRPIGVDIVASMYPPGSDGRIPVAAVVGDATGAAKMHLKALLASVGVQAGVAGESETVVGERRWLHHAVTPQERAGLLMQNTIVDAAILETSARELIQSGFGNDRCNVALVLNPGEAEEAPVAEEDPIRPEANEYLQALCHALAPNGVLVLPAEGEGDRIETDVPTSRLFLVALQPDLARVRDHLAAGGRGLMVQGDTLVLAQGAEAPMVLGKRPGNMAVGETAGLLAALAAGLVLGQDVETLKRYLRSLP